MHDLEVQILYHRTTLEQASEVCGELDSILTMAAAAEKYEWTMPILSADSTAIDIQGGRHPLLELTTRFIENNCVLGENPVTWSSRHGHIPRTKEVTDTRALLITGPNQSGKSVYLKQVALIVYLAHIGSFVPAKRAFIGLTDKILTRISTKECSWQSESAFSIDLRQIALAMNGATRRSLVLIDEFGKGTQPQDGVGLLAAVMRNLLSRNEDTPRTVIATHLSEDLKSYYREPGSVVDVARLNVRFDPKRYASDTRMVYLYTLERGEEGTSSFGLGCASLNGVDGSVVRRATAIMGLLQRNASINDISSQLGKAQKQRLEAVEATSRDLVYKLKAEGG